MEQITRKAELKRLIQGHQTDAMANACDRLRDDDEIVAFDIEHGALNYEYYSDRLKNDENVILAALDKNEKLILKVPEKYRTKKTYIKKAIKVNELVYKYLNDEIKSDRDIVMYYIENGSFSSLYHVPAPLKNDYEIVLLAVSDNHGSNLEYASDRLKDDITIVSKAIEIDGYNLKHASDRLRDNKDVVLSSFIHRTSILSPLEFASDRLKDNEEVVLTAVKQNGLAIQHASERFKNNKSIALEAVKSNFNAYKHLSPTLKEDRDIIKEVIRKMESDDLCDASLQFLLGKSLTEDLKKDKTFIRELVDINPLVVLNDICSDDAEMLLLAIEHNHMIIHNVKRKFLKDKDFIVECYRRNPKTFDIIHIYYANNFMGNLYLNKDILLAVAKVNPEFLDSRRIDSSLYKELKQTLKEITSPDNPDYKKELFKDFKGYLKYQFSSDKEVSGLIESLKSLKSYNSLVEALASQYTFSPSASIKDKAEEYLEFLKFDMSKIDEVLY